MKTNPQPKATHILTEFYDSKGRTTWRVYREGDFWYDEDDGTTLITVKSVEETASLVLSPFPKPPVFRLW